MNSKEEESNRKKYDFELRDYFVEAIDRPKYYITILDLSALTITKNRSKR